MCGEHPQYLHFDVIVLGSSPHVRGARVHACLRARYSGIIPACAGSTNSVSHTLGTSGDHPRMCGEHAAIGVESCAIWGSSPHVRGALQAPRFHHSEPGIIPACAGSTAAVDGVDRFAGDHPRMCGEHISRNMTSLLTWGSSPHVRGALRYRILDIMERGIIPACAGSTRRNRGYCLLLGDHPRMCGEHARRFCQLAFIAGSSPHVRGALLHLRVNARNSGIIPACAGSTPVPVTPK